MDQPDTILPRAVGPLYEKALATMRVVVVTGPRQAGKSTFVKHHPRTADRPYLTLDDGPTLLRARGDPAAFVRSERVMTIDEVQRDPDLILAIKVAVDAQRPRLPGQFVLTGSANLLMLQRIADSRAGRAYYTRLWPLTRREQLGLGTHWYLEPVLRRAAEPMARRRPRGDASPCLVAGRRAPRRIP